MLSTDNKESHVDFITCDSWNRMRTMTCPDGEVVTYHYNAAGQIDGLTSNKPGHQSVIVDRIGYDKEGAIRSIRSSATARRQPIPTTGSMSVCRRCALQRTVRLSWRTGIVMMLWIISSVSRMPPTQRRWRNSTRRSWEEGVCLHVSWKESAITWRLWWSIKMECRQVRRPLLLMISGCAVYLFYSIIVVYYDTQAIESGSIKWFFR